MKTRIFTILTGICGVLLLLQSCQKDTTPINRVDLKGEFRFGIGEYYSTSTESRICYLTNTMLRELDCEKAQFNSNLTVKDQLIEYKLVSVSEGKNCRDTTIFPSDIIPLKKLKEKKYDLTLSIGDLVTIEGTLKNTGDYFYFNVPPQEGVESADIYLRKVPEQLVWGRLSISDNQYLDIVNNFIDTVNMKFGEAKLKDGEYTPFKIKDGHVTLNSAEYPPITSFHSSFLIKVGNSEETNRLTEMLENFRSEYTDNIHLQAYSWDGREL